jgi:hypothetical protein
LQVDDSFAGPSQPFSFDDYITITVAAAYRTITTVELLDC